MGSDRITPTTQTASVASVTDMEETRARKKLDEIRTQAHLKEKRELESEIEELERLLQETEARVREEEELAVGQAKEATRYQKEAERLRADVERYRKLAEDIGKQNTALTQDMEARFETVELQIFGWEIYKSRMATVLFEQGMDPTDAKPQEEEEALMRGQMPKGMDHDSLGYLLLEYRSAMGFSERDITMALDALCGEPAPEPELPSAESADPLGGFVVEFTSEPGVRRPKKVSASGETDDDAPATKTAKDDDRERLSDERNAFRDSEAPTTLSVQSPAVEVAPTVEITEERPRITVGFGDLRPSTETPPIPLTATAPWNAEPPASDEADDAEEEDAEDSIRKTIHFDPGDVPNSDPPSRDAMLPQPPSTPPPSEQRLPGWKPPAPKHPPMVIRSGDPSKRRS